MRYMVAPITEGPVSKGGHNPPNTSELRPPAPGGSGCKPRWLSGLAMVGCRAVPVCSKCQWAVMPDFVGEHESECWKVPQ